MTTIKEINTTIGGFSKIYDITFQEPTFQSIIGQPGRTFNKPAINRMSNILKNHGYNVLNDENNKGLRGSDETPVTYNNIKIAIQFSQLSPNTIQIFCKAGKYVDDGKIIAGEIVNELQKLRTSVSSTDYLGGKKRRKTKKVRSHKNKKTRKH